jgi:hypothetical protein
MTGICMLERDSSGSLSSLLSLCRESFVAELSVRALAKQPYELFRKYLRVETADVFELLENISSGSNILLTLTTSTERYNAPSSTETLDRGLFFFVNEDFLLLELA